MTLPRIISVDDHVIEPPDLWARWLPSRYRDEGPRVVRSSYETTWPMRHIPKFLMAQNGPEADFWCYGGKASTISRGVTAAGRDQSEIEFLPVTYDEMRPGCYSVPERLADMDRNGIERSLCFPTFPRFCGQIFLEAPDTELSLACVRSYNDWTVEEWSGESGGRLIPLCIIPLWDPMAAKDEIERNAARGVRAVTLSELPQRLGLPSLYDDDGYWDPVLAACQDTGTVVCLHIGSASSFARSADDAPVASDAVFTSINSQMCLTDWVLSGALAKFPRLKIAMSESQVGWMPYLMERLDSIWDRHRSKPISGISSQLTERPSSYVVGRVYGCVVDDQTGVDFHRPLSIDQITFESDYPHYDSTFPDTAAYAERLLRNLEEEDVEKVLGSTPS